MSKKTRVEHKEYKQFKSSGKVPYSDDQYDQIKSQFLPRSQLDKLDPQANGHREYHYEYREEKTGKNDKKNGQIEVTSDQEEEYSTPTKTKPKQSESSTYYFERAEKEFPTMNTTGKTYNYESSTAPGYSIIRNVNSPNTTKKDLAHNVDELDSLLVDLQNDQKRSLNKSGYISDTAESTFSDFRRGTTPTSNNGYSSLRKEERIESSSWKRSPPPPPVVTKAAERRQEIFKEEKYTSGYTSDTGDSTYDYRRTLDKAPSSGYSTLKKEERVDHHQSSSWIAPSPPVVRKEIRQEERVDHHQTSSWVAPSPPVTRKEMRQEMFQETHESRIIPSQISPAIPHQVPAPTPSFYQPPSTPTLTRGGPMNKVTTTVKTYTYEVPADEPVPITTREHTYLASTDKHTSTTHHIPPPVPQTTSYNYKYTSNDLRDERVVYPQPANETKIIPAINEPDRGPYVPPGQSSYKFSETLFSREDRRERLESPSPFPRPATPSAGNQQPPKALDDLLNDFPEARFPTQTDGLYQRKVEVYQESSKTDAKKPAPPIGNSKNVAGPAVYYPPNHTPFQPKEEQKSMAMAANGAHASGRGMYEYESGSKTIEKSKEKKTAVPICLPLCCAMPCVIM